MRYKLDDKTWNKLYKCLKKIPKIYVGNEQKVRIFIEAVHWVMRTGVTWRDIPQELGLWNSIIKRFSGWTDKKVWETLHQELIEEPDMEWLLLNSTVWNNSEKHNQRNVERYGSVGKSRRKNEPIIDEESVKKVTQKQVASSNRHYRGTLSWARSRGR